MSEKVIKIPGPNHAITIEKFEGQVVVSFAKGVIATTSNALLLREATLPPVIYVPRVDIRMELLEQTKHATYCPYKGDASYFSVATDVENGINIAWSYETPYPAVSAIKDHLAFYADRVDIEFPPTSAPIQA